MEVIIADPKSQLLEDESDWEIPQGRTEEGKEGEREKCGTGQRSQKDGLALEAAKQKQ